MFGLMKRSRRRPASTQQTSTRLSLEHLETRFCMSATHGLASALGTLGGLYGAGLRHDQGQAGPVISNFTATEGYNNIWTFSGMVTDGTSSAAGLTVTFGGLNSLNGKTATVGSNGVFTLTVQLQPGEGGYATAQTTDSSGFNSNLAQVLVDPTPPIKNRGM
jgi:hypothetical protein